MLFHKNKSMDLWLEGGAKLGVRRANAWLVRDIKGRLGATTRDSGTSCRPAVFPYDWKRMNFRNSVGKVENA